MINVFIFQLPAHQLRLNRLLNSNDINFHAASLTWLFPNSIAFMTTDWIYCSLNATLNMSDIVDKTDISKIKKISSQLEFYRNFYIIEHTCICKCIDTKFQVSTTYGSCLKIHDQLARHIAFSTAEEALAWAAIRDQFRFQNIIRNQHMKDSNFFITLSFYEDKSLFQSISRKFMRISM